MGRLLATGAVAALATWNVARPSRAADAAPASGAFRVAGYLPDYRVGSITPEQMRLLTDLIVFSATPAANGELQLGALERAPWAKLAELKTQHRVRMILCVGGWNRSAGFAPVVASAEARARFVQSAVRLCLDKRLDGIDLDWEHPKDAAEQTGYARLLTDLRTGFQPHGLTLSVTMAAWQQLPAEGFAAVDWVHVMAYDNAGKHSTFESAQNDVQSLRERGVPPAKIVLGLPFYGRHTTQRERASTYAQIVEAHRPGPEVDEVDGLYFNGPATIRRKAAFALETKLGGVMVWELGQDLRDDRSLLRLVNRTVNP